MCLVRVGSKATPQEPSIAAPRPVTVGPLTQSKSRLPTGAVVQTVAPRQSSDTRPASRRSTGYYVDGEGRRRSFAVVESADGHKKTYVLDADGKRRSHTSVESGRRKSYVEADGRRHYIDADGTKKSYIVAPDGRRLSVVEVEPPARSGSQRRSEGTGALAVLSAGPAPPTPRTPRSRRNSQVVIIDQAPRSPRASGTLGGPRASGTLGSPGSPGTSGVLHYTRTSGNFSPAAPRAHGLGLGELDFPQDAAAGSLKVVRRGSSSRSPRASGGSLHSPRENGVVLQSTREDGEIYSNRSPGDRSGPSGGDASSPRPRASSYSRRRPSFTTQRLAGGYEIRSSDGELVRIETAGPGSPRVERSLYSDGNSYIERSPRFDRSPRVDRNPRLDNTPSGSVAMARVRSDGVVVGMARRPSAGLSPRLGGAGMARSASGGVVMTRTTGAMMARSVSGGAALEGNLHGRSLSGGVGMARTTSGTSSHRRTTSSGAVPMIRTTSAGTSGSKARGGGVPMTKAASGGVPMSKTRSAGGVGSNAALMSGALDVGTPMSRSRSASLANGSVGLDPHASNTSVKTNSSRRGRERIVVVDESGVRTEYNR